MSEIPNNNLSQNVEPFVRHSSNVDSGRSYGATNREPITLRPSEHFLCPRTFLTLKLEESRLLLSSQYLLHIMTEADIGTALNTDTGLSSTTPNTGSSVHVSSSHAEASGVVLPESNPAYCTVTSPSDNHPTTSPPQLLVIVRGFKQSPRDPKMARLEEEERMVCTRNRVEKMTYSVRRLALHAYSYATCRLSHGVHDRFQEASEYIKDRSGFKTYGAPGKLKATFMQAGLDEDVKPSYIMEEDWGFLIRHASALYMDFQRVSSGLAFCFDCR